MGNKGLVKKIGAVLLIWCLLLYTAGGLLPVYADGEERGLVTVSQAIDDAADYILSVDGNALTDWDAYALAKAGKPVPASYLASVSRQLQQNGGSYGSVTDYDRVVIAVKAAGGNPENIAAGDTSYNLVEKIYNSNTLTSQGTNGAIYSLLALSSGTYNIPLTAKWNPDKIVAWLLTQRNADGGWPLAPGGASSVDITAAAVTALSPYKLQAGVQQAIDGAIQWLASQQLPNGGFSEYGENSESAAQVILALCAAGIDARSSSFAKANGNPLSYLFSYRQSDGGFAHMAGLASNAGATGQALMALAAYHTFTGGNSGAYEAVLTGSKMPGTANVTVHIAGPTGMIAEGTAFADNAYAAVAQVLQASGIAFHEGAGHFIDSVNGISNSSDGYWLYNVKRQGAWDFAGANVYGLDQYTLHNGDEIYLYYSGSDTALVKSITVNPALPVAGQAIQVNVQQTVWNWVYNREDITVAANVYVELGGQKVLTDSQGTALFPSGLPGGSYKAVVTGYRPGMAPAIVTASADVQVGTATLQVEGGSGTYATGTANSPILLDSVQELLTANQIPFQVVNSSFGKYLKSVGTEADSWNYAVYRQGKWIIPQVGMADYTLQPGDRAVIYYGGYDANWNPTTYLVDSIALNPEQPKANESFTVTVKKTLGDGTSSPASGVQVKIGSLTATTNSQGVATFAGLPAGTYTLDISGYVAGKAPTIVHTAQTITIQPRPVGTGGVFAGNPVVYLSVTGDSSKGVILSGASIPLQSGDTPYSILIRALGASRVQSSGSGATAYVQGIDGLKEFDRGPLSGWMYAVNGSYLNVGADAVILKPGDVVSWRYTLNGGQDLNPGGTAWAGASAAQTDPAMMDALQQLEFSYSNQKPISEIAKPAVVLNRSNIMPAAAANALKEQLATSAVNVQKVAAADAATFIADPQQSVQLQIPAGAVKESTMITVSKLPSADKDELVSPMYEFGPSGLTFDKPVQISIKAPIAADSLDQLALVWLNEQTGQWIPVPAVIDAETGTVTGLVNHFTKFAVIDKAKAAAKAPADAVNEIGTAIELAAKWLTDKGELSDWSAYALGKAGAVVPPDYLPSVEANLKEKNGTFRNVTDYERLALSVEAAGGNPESIGGYNLIERIYNNERMEAQGSNGPIYALLALNGKAERIPSDAKWPVEKLLQWVLEAQDTDGSWPLVKGETGNVDLTAAALAALAPYKERASVKTAIEKAIQWLSTRQAADGGFALNGVENAESTAQVIWGLSAMGIDPVHSPYFKTGSNSMLAYLLGLQLKYGAFPHERGGEADVMATEQALMALGAYQSLLQSAGRAPIVKTPGNSAPVYADKADIASWALPFVEKASAYRIMEGTGASAPVFEPKKPVTRIQFAVILLRILGEAPAAEGKTNFADVAPGAWYAGYVAKAVSKGIAEGVSPDRFAPDAAISRQEMAIMLGRALHIRAAAEAGSHRFVDLSEAYPEAAPFIQAVQEKGLMEGDDSGKFLPREPATREMAAVVAVRAYEWTKQP
jgi:prenyltransferase beta subunit